MALVLTSFATGVWIVALVWEVIRLGGGPAQLSLVSTAGAVGVLLPALLAGVVADRVPQKTILLAVAGMELAGMSLVAGLSLAGVTELWHLGVVAFVIGMATAFYYPAYSAWLPALVPESDLLAVNGFEGMVRPTVGWAIGPAVAGVVVGVASSGAAVAVAAGASLLGLWRTDGGADDAGTPRDRARGVRRGWSRHGAPRHARGLPVHGAHAVAALHAAVRLADGADDHGSVRGAGPVPGQGPPRWRTGDHARVMAAFGIGGAIGSLAMASVRMPRRYLTLMILGWGLGCLPLIAMGMATEVWMVVAAAFVLGALFSAPMVIWGTLLQRRVPAHLLGRVASLDFFVSVSLMPVSMALAGPVAALIGLRWTFLVAGTVPVGAAVVAIWWARLMQDELAHPLRDEPAVAPRPT